MKQLFILHGKENLFSDEIPKHKATKLLETYKKLGNSWVKIRFIPWAKELLQALYTTDIKIALLTASPRECMSHVLNELWIHEIFDHKQSIYDIDPSTNKPFVSKAEPEVYLHILRQTTSNTFIMIEDGHAGMQWARLAWGKSISVLWANTVEQFPLASSFHRDLTSVSTEEILSMMS